MTEETSIRDRLIDIIVAVSIRHQIKAADILGKRRFRAIAYARMEAIARIRNEVGLSYPRIGRIFGVDHSSALEAARKYNNYLATFGEWPVKNPVRPIPDFEPGKFRLVTHIVREERAAVTVVPMIDAAARPKAKPRRKTVRAVSIPAPAEERERVIMRPCKALKLAETINSHWARKGINANARAVMADGRIVIKSDLCLGVRV